MGRIINLELNLKSLIDFAEKSLKNGDPLSCALNLNEAMETAFTREEKQAVYATYIKCFRTTSNIRSVVDVVAKDVANRVEDDYFRMDFDLKRRFVCDDEDEAPDYEMSRTYNEIKNLIAERKYDEAMAKLAVSRINYSCMDGVVEALNEAVACDKRLNLDKYLVPLIGIMANSPSQSEMLQVLLEGGKTTHDIMVDSADFLLEEEDSNSLCLMGIAFFQSNELETAEKFFMKALEVDAIDEDALYYMTVIGKLLDKPEYSRYWNRYKEVYKITEPPIGLLEEFFDSKERTFLVPYLTLPLEFLEKVGRRLILKAPSGDIDDEFAREFTEFACLSPETPIFTVMKVLGSCANKPKLQETFVKLLSLSKVPSAVKEKIVGLLADGGYEGDICILTEKRVVFARFAKLHRRVSRAWQLIYKLMLRSIPFSDVYIPIRCSVLSAVIKRLDATLAPGEDDMGFALALAFINYLRRLKVNIDILSIIKAINIDTDVVDRGLEKFGLDTVYL